jgi:hypothetical protein
MLSFLLSQSKITPENNLETSTTIIMLGLGISSSTVTYCGSRVSMKWKGPIRAKGKEDLKSFIEKICAETTSKNRYRECIIQQVLHLQYRNVETLVPLILLSLALKFS